MTKQRRARNWNVSECSRVIGRKLASPLCLLLSCLSPALCGRSVITTVHHCGLAPTVARPRRRQGRWLLQATHKTDCRAWDLGNCVPCVSVHFSSNIMKSQSSFSTVSVTHACAVPAGTILYTSLDPTWRKPMPGINTAVHVRSYNHNMFRLVTPLGTRVTHLR